MHIEITRLFRERADTVQCVECGRVDAVLQKNLASDLKIYCSECIVPWLQLNKRTSPITRNHISPVVHPCKVVLRGEELIVTVDAMHPRTVETGTQIDTPQETLIFRTTFDDTDDFFPEGIEDQATLNRNHSRMVDEIVRGNPDLITAILNSDYPAIRGMAQLIDGMEWNGGLEILVNYAKEQNLPRVAKYLERRRYLEAYRARARTRA